MAYNKQTLDGLITRFGLQVVNQARLFEVAPPVPISNLLREVLAANTAFALEVGTEKARSEFIVAPVLSEIREQMKPPAIALFRRYNKSTREPLQHTVRAFLKRFDERRTL